MQDAILLIGFGVLFLAGLALDSVGRHIHVPRVTLLILLGAVVGPPVLDWLPRGMVEADDVVAPTALTMVAFLLGGALHRRKLAAHGREILMISITVVAVSVIVVAGGLMLAGVSAAFAFLLGGISAATAPAATLDVIRQSGKTGRFVDNLRGIVAIDDAWGLIVFSLVLTVAGVLAGNGHSNALADGIIEAGGSILLGLAIGLPGAFLTGRIKPGEPTLIEALGLVFLCAGLALWFELSFLLAGMTAGVTIVNLARHHDRPFHEIERIEWPFVLVFFVMAGATLDLQGILAIGWIGLGYVALRTVSRVLGAWVGGRLAGLPGRESGLMGLALMPQAGVAIGMALVVAERFPEIGQQVLTITIASTIVFEIFGPLLTMYALNQADRDQAVGANGTGGRIP
jgi:Kef-type K+ transport system membrane component KefB